MSRFRSQKFSNHRKISGALLNSLSELYCPCFFSFKSNTNTLKNQLHLTAR